MPKEVGIPVQVIMVHLACDCEGELQFTGATKPGLTEKTCYTMHRCNKCQKVEIVNGPPYPRQTFRMIQQPGPAIQAQPATAPSNGGKM